MDVKLFPQVCSHLAKQSQNYRIKSLEEVGNNAGGFHGVLGQVRAHTSSVVQHA